MMHKLFLLLLPYERRLALWLFLAMLLMAFFDVLGVASIMPFMLVVSNPDAIESHMQLAKIYNVLHFSSPYQFIFFLGFLVFIICVVGNLYSIFTTWLTVRFVNLRDYSLSTRLLKGYLFRSYMFFLNRNTMELSKNILSEVYNVSNNVLFFSLELLSRSIVVLFILLFLIIIDPTLALLVFLVMGGMYTIIYFLVRRRLGHISKVMTEINEKRFKILSETFGGIKDVKLLHKENYFLKRYSTYAKYHAKHKAFSEVIFVTPRYLLEALSSGTILLVIVYLLLAHKNMSNAVSYLAVYAFASMRLMPAVQQIFHSIARIRVNKDAVDGLYNDLVQSQKEAYFYDYKGQDIVVLPFKDQLILQDIHFSYEGVKQATLQQINISIPARVSVGFVGPTGSGKTTSIDLILGLLKAQSGKMMVDGVEIDSTNLINWQKNIGYVPQSIYLTDDTIARNIAFGVADEQIDMEALMSAAKTANLHDFIINDLPLQYQTVVGERGVRLSGGQRQRIGIARALYHNPEVLVLDEATSALDNSTENIIMEAIQTLAHKKTIIMVAHRLSTVKNCDKIYLFEKGVIIAEGPYDELYAHNEKFKQMVDLGKM